MAQTTNTLYLVDGSALAYRSYFAFAQNPLRTKRGEYTSVVYGFATTLLRLLSTEKPTHIAVARDTKHKNFRHELYDEYKATREKMPEDMVDQLPRLDELLETMGIANLEKKGFEADDIIATLTRAATDKGWDVVIVTGDKDLFQLVNDHVKIFNLRKISEAGEWFNPDGVEQKMGVRPELIRDLLALMGDTSDNIPGAKGVGPKTAVKLLDEYGSLDAVLDHAEEIKRPKLRESLLEFRERADTVKKLVDLAYDVELDTSLEDLRVPTLNTANLKNLFVELEFTSLVKSLGTSEEEQPKIKQDYSTIDTEAALKNVVEEIKKKKLFAFDTETTGLDWLTCELVGISLATDTGVACYIPLKHVEGKNLDEEVCRTLLNPVFKDAGIGKIAQNFKYDYHVLIRHGYEFSSFDHDPMLASYVLDPAGQHGLDALALKHFDYSMQPISELIGTGKSQTTFDKVPVEKASFYSAEDADFTFRLNNVLEPAVKDIGGYKLLHEIELPLSRVLATMERTGVRVDVDFLKSLSKEMAEELELIISDIYELAGEEFNINSTAQLSTILFEKLNLKPLRKTAKKTGYSTDVNVLTELAKSHDLPKRILDYRKLQKLKSTYIDSLPKLVNQETGRIHTSYNQAVAATGRLSSTDPNLQNIPIKTEEGSRIRQAFIPTDDDHVILTADYSQVELRVLAHFADEEALIESFNNNEDIHRRTASEVYGVDLDDVTPDQRRVAKTANFAVIYGVTAYGLSQQSDMSVGEAKEFIDIYFARYPQLRKFIESTIVQARKDGHVTTLFGRRRYLPEINSKNNARRQFAERTAVNTIIQGTAAEMIKIAMIQIDKDLSGMKSKMIMQVHDELVFDVQSSELARMKEIVRDRMEHCVELKVPITVEMGSGPNWLDSK